MLTPVEQKIYNKLNTAFQDVILMDVALEINKTWSENGLDSLDVIELLLEMEKQFEICISDKRLIHVNTPRQLIKVILEHLPE